MANNDEQARYMNNEKGKGRASVSDPEQNKGPQYASTQNSEADNKSDHNGRKEASRSSTPTVQGRSRSPTKSQQGSNDTMSWGNLQQYQQPRIRIQQNLTKTTSFDRARDGDELYELWVSS